ncbi:MAG: hypothetical protein M3020_00790 [Myxococcota bacterium]|jgi:hypothetical protein|nr:hypothetical protein [Myxococcota bacterium]
MANGVRVLLRPELQKAKKTQVVSGVSLGSSLFGTGPAELSKGQLKNAKLVLHAAFLARARDEAKLKPSYTEFASLSGTIKLETKPSRAVFTVAPGATIQYTQPPPANGRFRRIRLHYDAATFSGVPAVPAPPAAGKPPAPPHPLRVLVLPEEPAGMRFLVVGAVLEIDGKAVAAIDDNDKLDVPLVPIRIRFLKVDPLFAPSKETLSIKYSISGLIGSDVTLEITSKHYASGPIFKRSLTPAEVIDGAHTVTWDGKCNPSGGDLKDKFLTPLFGPYELTLTDGAGQKPKTGFKVLYHSVELVQGPFTPDGKEPTKTNKKDWVQYKLNELGYWGGPVGHDFDDYLKKAVIRYKANHRRMHEIIHANYTDAITPQLETALAANENPQRFVEGNAFSKVTGRSKIYVEALTYEELAGGGDEFGTPKAPKEKQRLNRPLLPILAKVYLRGKKLGKVEAPDAIGPVRVNWLFTDVREDLSRQVTLKPKEPSRTRTYVEAALKTKSGRTATAGDNCYQDFGGIRDSAANDFQAPFVLGTRYEPFDVKADAGQKVCFSLVHADDKKFPDRVGQAGVLFRPSFVAGDAYQLRADLDFSTLPNHADLDKLHGVTSAGKRIKGRTGVFQIIRRAKVALRLTWPARSNDPQWLQIQKEFERAYVELDVSGIDTFPISNFLTQAEYQAIVAAKTAHPAASVSLLPNALVGVPLPAQGNQTAAQYRQALKAFTEGNYWDRIVYDLRKKLTQNIRPLYPVGFIIAEFLTHVPVNIQTAPPANTSVTPAHTNYVTWTFSIGLPDSMVFGDQKDPDKVYYVVAHEMGHNFFLQHWENAGGSTPADHDTSDHNCSMSYSGGAPPHQTPGVYTPRFCGKCNLKLRGWDIDAAGLPAHS